MENNQNRAKQKFGLVTTISMIIGTVIGSGIFFKTDDILRDTDGNVLLGVLALILGASGIVFGGLTLATLSEHSNSTHAGGLITYGEMAYNKFFSFVLGFFQMSVYFPALIAIVLFVAANYTLILFPNLLLNIWGVTFIYFIAMFSLNHFSTKIAGLFQTSTTVIKMIPLLTIGIIGVLFGNPAILSKDQFSFSLLFASSSAIVSVAFSYDGWTIAPSIAHEIKNAKRNLSLALSISPIIILIIYLIYFVGMSSILGPDKIIALGDAHVSKVAIMYFGVIGNKLILATIIISVLGTANGLTLGGIRTPYLLAIRNTLPKSKKIAQLSTKTDTAPYLTLIIVFFTLLWLLLHFVSLHINTFSFIDISSIPIITMYIFYFLLFISVIKKYIQKSIPSFLHGVIFPSFACLGSLILIIGVFSNITGIVYLIISFVFIFISVIIYKIRSKEVNE